MRAIRRGGDERARNRSVPPFILTTYNVLADAYVRRERYPRTPPEVLEPARRLGALIAQLAALDADVLCLQEVEPPVFAAIEARLGPLGYTGRFAQKGARKPDGCVTFVRGDAFRLAGHARLVYADARANEPASGHVALLTALEHGGRTLGVANTHLKWDPPGTPLDEQYGYRQIAQLLRERELRLPGCAAWVLCGDLNVTPDADRIAHVRSAGFADTHDADARAPTACIGERARTIDYIFHSAGLRAEPLSPPAVGDQSVLPGFDRPSDHVPLAARFVWGGDGM